MHKAHFRLFGVPIRVEPFFVIVAALWGLQLEPLWLVFAFVVIAFVSVLVHEMGHALMYRYAGQRSAIVLHAFGGFTIPAGGGRRVLSKPMAIAVSLAGVVTQLLFMWLPARLLKDSSWGLEQLAGWDGEAFNWYVFLYYVQLLSLWWAVFNILPIRPLDGGHVVETLFGFEMACKISIAAAAAAALFVFRQWDNSLFGGLFFVLFAFLNYRDLKAGEHTGAFDVDAPDAGGGSGGGARRQRAPGGRGGGGRGRGLRGRRRSGHLTPVPSMDELSAELQAFSEPGEVETRAWNALRRGDGQQAGEILKQSGTRAANPFLQASVALAQGHDGLALDMFQAAYMAEPGGAPNTVVATVLADRGQAVPLAATLIADGPIGVEAASSLQTHLHYAERFQVAAEVGEQVFAAGPRSPAQTAFEVACSWAKADKADEALRWVEAAVDAGFKAPSVLDGEPDLQVVRAHPGWSAVRARLTA